MDHQNAQAWLDRYVAAWLSYDPGDVALLFSEDVRYRYHPYDEPIVGRDAVVASWLGEGDSDDAPYVPGASRVDASSESPSPSQDATTASRPTIGSSYGW